MNSRWFFALLGLGLSLASSVAAPFAEFFVSPAGRDANPGTRAEPFQTLARARDAVRAVNESMTGDIVVHLRGGEYRLAAPLELGVADSGRNGFHVRWEAWKREVPVLTGGERVTNWTRRADGVFQAPLVRPEKLRALWVNGQAAHMTQREVVGLGAWGSFTVRGDEPWAETAGETLDGIRFRAEDLPDTVNAADVELLQHRVWNYLVLCARGVTNVAGERVLQLQQPSGAIAATMAWDCNVSATNRFVIRNVREWLAAPGEFYFDRAAQRLLYRPRPGEDLARTEVIAPRSAGLLRVIGEGTNARVKNILFRGLTFTHDDWQLPEVGGAHGLAGVQSLALYTKFRSDGNHHRTAYNICDLPQATVEIRNAQNVRLERNRFTQLGSGCAVSLVNDVADSAVVGNVFRDLAGNAVNLGHPQHYRIGDGARFGPGVEGVCANVTVANNFIRDVSREFKQGEAISGFFTESARVLHNDIARVPYGGIALGWWWGNAEIPASTVPRDNVIAFNRVFDTQRELPKDGGAIYVLGEQPGGRIVSNYVHSLSRLIYPDDGSAGWTIARNVLAPQPGGKWLFIWTPRIHSLAIDDNFITGTNWLNNATNGCQPTGTVLVAEPLRGEARRIAKQAGLEREWREIAR